jgi:hypothetical protein
MNARSFGKWLGIAFGALLVVAFAWTAYTGLNLFISATTTAKLGSVTAALTIVALIYNNARQQAREIKARHFAEKRLAYQKFFDFMFEIFSAQKNGLELSNEHLIEQMTLIVKDIMIWGSAETINQYNQFVRNSLSPR